jgi:diacylglycerol kinase
MLPLVTGTGTRIPLYKNCHDPAAFAVCISGIYRVIFVVIIFLKCFN